MAHQHTQQIPAPVAPIAPVALVTGAARRIGAAIARALHAQGYRVALHYWQSASEAQALAQQLNILRPGSAVALCADIRVAHFAEALVAGVSQQLGPPTLLVNNASSYFPTPFGSITAAQLLELSQTNLHAPLLLTQAAQAAGGLRAVVNLLDTHSRHQPRAGFAAYTVAKDALWALTELLAVELAPQVRVNGVALGHIAAEVHSPPLPSEAADLHDKASQLPRVPLGRAGTPSDVAAAVVWLASDSAAYVTGSIVTVDGGRHLL